MSNNNIDFNQYQKHVKKTDKTNNNNDILLYGLVGEVGEIFTAFKKNHLETFLGFKDELQEDLGDTLWYLTAIALRHDIDLSSIIEKNIKKSHSLFDEGEMHIFDEEYCPNERFPRQFNIEFVEETKEGKIIVKIKKDGEELGDPITDNNYNSDDYRYHDAFHFAYLAVLGWSPVIRKMLNIKRKSNQKIDEVEDGGRAAIIEEAVSFFVFNYLRKKGYCQDNQEITDINFTIIKTVMLLVSDLEVKICTAKEWQKTIILGYEIFNKLRDNKGGILSIDLDKRSIDFQQ